MADFDKRAPGFDRIVPADATIELLACGFGFTEGPLWDGGSLLFSDIPNSRIARWRPDARGAELLTHRCPSDLANGLTFDHQHRLIACEGGTRRLTRTEADGTLIVLAESYQGKRLNSPNDVVVAADGAIYFSDPFWGNGFNNPFAPRVRAEEQELPFDGVFRLSPSGGLTLLVDDFERPNGLAFSPDGKVLYVDDTRRGHIRAFDVRPDGSLAGSRVLAELTAPEQGVPDGMKVDVEGNLYCTGAGGVWVVAASGEILGRITPPEPPANVAFGGADWRDLYMTARSGLYRVTLSIPGVATWS